MCVDYRVKDTSYVGLPWISVHTTGVKKGPQIHRCSVIGPRSTQVLRRIKFLYKVKRFIP